MDLLRGAVEAGHLRAVVLLRMEHEAAETGPHVDHLVARADAELPADVLDLVALRLLERARALAPIAARVHHEGVVQPEAVEVRAQPVVEAGILPRAFPACVAAAPLVPGVAQAHEGRGLVAVPAKARGERGAEIPLDIDVAVEVGIQQADMAEERDAKGHAQAVADDRFVAGTCEGNVDGHRDLHAFDAGKRAPVPRIAGCIPSL